MRLGVLAGALALASVVAGSGASLAADGWLADSRNGCKLWILNLKPGQAVRWDGACSGGFASGRGKFTVTQDGQSISQGEAEFQNGRRNGRGFVVTPDGTRFEGEYRNGSFEGRVIEIWADGDRYDGEYRDGKRNGYGVWTTADGKRYEGEWKDGGREGKGVWTARGRERYEGEYRNDERNGRGVAIWADGERYEGEWRNGKPHGMGSYYAHSTRGGMSYFTGQWEDGCFQRGNDTATIFKTRAECGFPPLRE